MRLRMSAPFTMTVIPAERPGGSNRTCRLPPVQSSTSSRLLVFARPPLGIPVNTASASAWFPSTYRVTSTFERFSQPRDSWFRLANLWSRASAQPFAYAWTRATPPQNNWGYGASRAERRLYPSRPHDTLLDLLSRVGGRIRPGGRAAVACCSVAPSDRRSAEHEATIPRPPLAIRRAPCATRSQQMTFGRSSRGHVSPWLGRRPNMRCHSGA